MIYAEIAHQMGLLPLAWLLWLRVRGQRRDVAYWVLAAAFAVSWVADTAAHFVDPWVVSVVFPVSQVGLVGAVLLERRRAAALVVLLTAVGIVAVTWRGVSGPDVILSSVASAAVVAMVWGWPALGRLRVCLLVYFGLGQVAWIVHAVWLIVPTYFPYQICRLAGLVLFCWATWETAPRLKVERGRRVASSKNRR